MVAFINWVSHETLGLGREDSEGKEEPSALFLKDTSCPNHVYPMQHSAACPRCLAKQSQELWTYHYKARSQQVSRCRCGSKFPQQGGSSYLSTAIPSEGKLRPHGGALDLEEMGVFSMELLLFFQSLLTFWHVEPEAVWFCQIESHLSVGDQ